MSQQNGVSADSFHSRLMSQKTGVSADFCLSRLKSQQTDVSESQQTSVSAKVCLSRIMLFFLLNYVCMYRNKDQAETEFSSF